MRFARIFFFLVTLSFAMLLRRSFSSASSLFSTTTTTNKRIVIAASDVAAAVNRNRYKSSDEVLEKLWQKYQADTLTILTKTEKQLEAVASDASGQATAILQQAEALSKLTKDSKETAALVSDLSQKLRENVNLSQESKNLAVDLLQSKVFKQHGIQKEDQTIKKIEKEVIASDSRLVKVDKIFSVPLLVSSLSEYWYDIAGRIDCLELLPTGEKRVYEVKNRANRLFKKLTEYEKIQVMVYMSITGFQGPSPALLVEQYNQEKHVLEVPWDEDYYQTITNELKDFVVKLDNILVDSKARNKYLADKKEVK